MYRTLSASGRPVKLEYATQTCQCPSLTLPAPPVPSPGEYFLSEEQKTARKQAAQLAQQAQRVEDKAHARLAAFVAPREDGGAGGASTSGRGTQSAGQAAPQQSVKELAEELKRKSKRAGVWAEGAGLMVTVTQQAERQESWMVPERAGSCWLLLRLVAFILTEAPRAITSSSALAGG